MKQTDPQMKIRLPPDLKKKITEAAGRAGHSMNAEIVGRLQESFEREARTAKVEDATLDDVLRLRNAHEEQISKIDELLSLIKSGKVVITKPEDDHLTKDKKK